MKEKSALLIFHDDSSLIVARRFADLIALRGWKPEFLHYLRKKSAKISPRQLEMGLGPWPLSHVEGRRARDEKFLSRFDMVVSAKFPISFQEKWREGRWRFRGRRPCFVGLFPGIELRPAVGFQLRQFADVLCLNTAGDLNAYENESLAQRPAHQRTVRFNPGLFAEDAGVPAFHLPRSPRQLAFFVQSVVPLTKSGRKDVLETLIRTAEAHPKTNVVIKLRHRIGENRNHTHIEEYPFETLVSAYPDMPANLSFSDVSMDEVLKETDLALTCSSTAGMEALARGIPTMFLLDFAEAEQDPLTEAARNFLRGSGLLATRQSVVSLDWKAPASDWISSVLSTPADLDELLNSVDAFHAGGLAAQDARREYSRRWWRLVGWRG